MANSIAKHIDGYDIAQEIRLERTLHKGSFLIVEGSTDMKRFGPFLHESCDLVNAYGKANAILATELLSDEGFLGILAVVDADFDRIFDTLYEHENIIYSEHHDLDLDWAISNALSKYLGEVADPTKLATYGSITDLSCVLLSGLKPVSLLKYLNMQNSYNLKLREVRFDILASGLEVDFDSYFTAVADAQSASRVPNSSIKTNVYNLLERQFDLHQITSGHDFCCLLGLGLRDHLGDRRAVHSWASEIEMGLRLAFSDGDFTASSLFPLIIAWEEENSPYVIVADRLRPVWV